jgi:DNA-binding HxlR family transcriptional regulator
MPVATNEPEPSPPTALEAAVRRVGDRWSLLVVNALLDGPRRFNELLDVVAGVAPNVLSSRLKHLEREGVVVSSPYSKRPPRFSYQLSATGAELAGALHLLAHWGAQGATDSEPVTHATCGTPLEARWYCPTCARLVERDEAGELRYA